MSRTQAGNRSPRGEGRAPARSKGKSSPIRKSPNAGGANGAPTRTHGGLHATHIQHIDRLLGKVMLFARPADAVVSYYFRENAKLGHRERGIIAEAIYAVLRRRVEFAQFAESGTGAASRRLALLGLAATLGRDALSPFLYPDEAEWLDRLTTIERSSLAPRVRANLPEWLYDELVRQHGEAFAAALGDAWLRPAPLDLRVNLGKTSREAALAELQAAGLGAEPTPMAPAGIRMTGKPALNQLPIFVNGLVEVQDEGSQLLCSLVAPRRGEMVVDFCAGAGGKTLALGAAMRSTGRLYAFDVSEKRLANLKPRLARSGLSNVHPVLIDSERDAKIKRLAGKADRVLVDAPCSGLGTLRRNPDLKWRQSPESVLELTAKQSAILDSAARLVKGGGRVVYATCSVLEAENEQIVRDFLAAHPNFRLVPAAEVLAEQKIEVPGLPDNGMFALYPHLHQTDGFFAAVLERTS
ncbi:Ribosomal RNA small subunit methyltransferase B (rRNA (cytosine-C(5)-)-methyltransferase) (16S rRNA m5C967 methyltransferase) [Cupriavidus taiwanensis]|uniref:Ribosomal RNA small subunit methyltransferase B (rRNA (cytosine-C(5)-)-methyltransferase) (16S rRNA m5C967 methyltransferase) n=1 Tax=Cupriavidus taiwanensis TaxID=164546 RepID=A0A976AWS7_9BURK|nr:RsmB/NOP family class I SAM-dependent RNA methyltransferase [Cupriavidus taiwanensis]SOZ55585.1 Ribosomal RNA small subunit methyltransferase B (rRNA (cytosine-C(5)-)-methyltransferase) (16S rRNA m5C967 methyltransferase) [Cupriavidus taiwanensis]SOZ57063.1 Ribosomal RNA small subunit methyltransferase B (rRNA (cytosine-C(5)-)-methyltransferase) (16S rRNA m5C967 methyltransferase) [Cupriavidus taiwanensis]SOZ59383.1 Ribosomal RNA small subunit methyltransferase B (rRNA (cytosine-C(5)-)-methyl